MPWQVWPYQRCATLYTKQVSAARHKKSAYWLINIQIMLQSFQPKLGAHIPQQNTTGVPPSAVVGDIGLLLHYNHS